MLVIIITMFTLRINAQQKFELLLQDNFDSLQIDHSRLANCYTWGRHIINNHVLQYYTDDRNFELQDGYLNIQGRRETIIACIDSTKPNGKQLADSLFNLRTFYCTSGMLRSREKFQYGKFEIRCKLPAGNGTWPAFWLYGGTCGEIDIFEKPWQFHHSITNNLHYDSAGVAIGDFRFIKSNKRNAFSKEFHTYTLVWEPDSLSWYIDNELVRKAYHPYKDCPMELICNLALADDNFWGHTPKRKNWQSVFTVDYIKVWQLKDQP